MFDCSSTTDNHHHLLYSDPTTSRPPTSRPPTISPPGPPGSTLSDLLGSSNPINDDPTIIAGVRRRQSARIRHHTSYIHVHVLVHRTTLVQCLVTFMVPPWETVSIGQVGTFTRHSLTITRSFGIPRAWVTRLYPPGWIRSTTLRVRCGRDV